MKIIYAISLVAALLVPTISSAQITKAQCLEYCDGGKIKTEDNCKLLPKASSKKSCRASEAADFKVCKKNCQCNPPTGGPC